ncbi:beta-N-acetylhexosaminidase [Lacibacter luteus]|uniref:beta-N-acetylhexosaminidase n=1 Tax=Lacibacter luteus TaxID=2508719 RepID=A0A4Q1CDP5_9BACT|nr:family 20 glycosylhydrolase [Lacibacter luteus]RXK57754.1 beta-N-acetylhexosaminidase [Lacibacter luteus]
MNIFFRKISLLLLTALLLIVANGKAQVKLPLLHDSMFSTYYHQRVTFFQSMPQTKDEIIFLGNSITDGSEWAQLFNDLRMKNHGISGDVTAGVLHRLPVVTNRKPSKIFLLIGTNDLARGVSADSVLKNMLLIADYIKQQSPKTKLYVQSILPVNELYGKFAGHTKNTELIKKVNEQLKANAVAHRYQYVDLYNSFSNENGKLKPELSNDGLHLMGRAYLLWKHVIYPYVYDLQPKAALIPQPQQLKWKQGAFAMYNCKTIVVNDNSLSNEASQLQRYLQSIGWEMKLTDKAAAGESFIEIGLGNVKSAQNESEAYQLDVNTSYVKLVANTAHGIFNATQTLKQLLRSETMIDAVSITDWPAFSWRGYMIDVGRNYMSMPLLKQQIDVMAANKLNIFHFHATEDIAWRIAIKKYPQLTALEHMLRNKGMYYNEAEIKELIAYCKERHITFVPEIDMPGHSAAFKRAMKTDMQSDSGLIIVKNILKEFIRTYDVPYIHIGADEVKITNKNFVPEVTAFIESMGKKVIGWQPGGNFSNSTIRQLWMDDNAHHTSNNQIQFIDSRHLYLNHMDPLEAVTTIFNRKIADKEKGDATTLGGTICMWHDRAVSKEEDVLNMNPVYPGMLAFAERSWQGGGVDGWVANIGEPNTTRANAFAAFEKRLLDHKQQFYSKLPFPYTNQSDLVWKLYGPFANNGDLAKQFSPEQKSFDADKTKPTLEQVGATVMLRHWWAPLIKGAIANAEDSTTWYAVTKIWSDEDETKQFWIGFNNLSRSPATDPPPANAWDAKQSAVWVNGKLIPAPEWKHAGQKGNSELPLADEGYQYRMPTSIPLKKGWNTVLLKAPVGSFKGKDWQNPVKWMFTFAPVQF